LQGFDECIAFLAHRAMLIHDMRINRPNYAANSWLDAVQGRQAWIRRARQVTAGEVAE
jgi:hypothetical protein